MKQALAPRWKIELLKVPLIRQWCAVIFSVRSTMQSHKTLCIIAEDVGGALAPYFFKQPKGTTDLCLKGLAERYFCGCLFCVIIIIWYFGVEPNQYVHIQPIPIGLFILPQFLPNTSNRVLFLPKANRLKPEVWKAFHRFFNGVSFFFANAKAFKGEESAWRLFW